MRRCANSLMSTCASDSRATRSSSALSHCHSARCGWRPMSTVSSTVVTNASSRSCGSRPDAQRERAPRQLRERRAGAEHRARRRRTQPRERVQAQGLARAVAPEDRHQLPGREADRQLAHQLARARRARSCPARRARPGSMAIRVVSIGSPVPWRGRRRRDAGCAGSRASVADSGRRPAMISVASCGYSGCCCGSAKPIGYRGRPLAGSYLSLAPTVCSSSCAITMALLPASDSSANACTTPTRPFCRPCESGTRSSVAGSW